MSSFGPSGRDGYLVVPSDTANLPQGVADFLYVTVTGNLKFLTELGSTITLTSVPAFTVIPYRASKVFATGTTATVYTGKN